MPLHDGIREAVFRSGYKELMKLYREEIGASFDWRIKDVRGSQYSHRRTSAS